MLYDQSEPEDVIETKKVSKMNGLKKDTRVTKNGSSFAKLLAATSNLSSDTKTSEDPRNPSLKSSSPYLPTQ